MSSNEQKRKPLFPLFQKSAPAQPVAEPHLPEEITSATENTPPATAQAPVAYGYTSSWQKAADNEQAETEREVMVNAAGMTSRLDEIFNAPATMVEEQSTAEPQCISAAAAERFSSALGPKNAPTGEAHTAAPQAKTVASSSFSDRLKQRVENTLQQSSTLAAVVAAGDGE